MEWKARWTVESSEYFPSIEEYITSGTIVFMSGTPAFPDRPAPEPIPNIEVFGKFDGAFNGKFFDDFGIWPSFVGKNNDGKEIIIGLKDQAGKVYRQIEKR